MGAREICLIKFLYFPKFQDYKIYVEPFGGGASMLLSQPLGHVEIYNDLWNNVYSLFKVISDKKLFKQFKERCDIALYHEKLSDEYKNALKTNDLSVIDRAFYYWYVNRTRHNGIGGFSTNCYIRRNMSKSTSDFLSCIERLKELHDRLSSVIILNKNAIEVINKYNAENVFIYADPPYHWDTRTSTRYDIDMPPKTQTELIDTFLQCKSKILLSGYINKEYDRLENAGWKRIDLQIKTISGNFEKKTKIESLYLNY